MMNYHTRVFALLAFAGTLLIWPGFATAADTTLTNTINTAGRQRMLVQRIVKAYVQVGQGITPQVSRRQLKDAVLHFDKQLLELKQLGPDARGRQSIARLDALWRPFKAVAMQWEWFQNALELERAASYGLIVINASEAILNSMELVTGMYERLTER